GAGLAGPHAAGVDELAPELPTLPPAGVGGVGAKRRKDAEGGADDGGGGRGQGDIVPAHDVVAEPGDESAGDKDEAVLPLPKEHADKRRPIRDHHDEHLSAAAAGDTAGPRP